MGSSENQIAFPYQHWEIPGLNVFYQCTEEPGETERSAPCYASYLLVPHQQNYLYLRRRRTKVNRCLICIKFCFCEGCKNLHLKNSCVTNSGEVGTGQRQVLPTFYSLRNSALLLSVLKQTFVLVWVAWTQIILFLIQHPCHTQTACCYHLSWGLRYI